MMDGLSDLQSKYSKIAAEYSKLRAQIPVLKKAVTEEQSKNAVLRDELKHKDQLLRIAESEADSLSFRNQQLTCRVTFLQRELESFPLTSRKGASKHVEEPQFLQDFDEEFSKKVAENATLIFTLNEYKERHEFEIKALKDEIDALKHQLTIGDDDRNHHHHQPSISTQMLTQSDTVGRSTVSHKNVLGETIQKALEKQLFETQQTLQETIVERDRLKQRLKLFEENMKNGSEVSGKELKTPESGDMGQDVNLDIPGSYSLSDHHTFPPVNGSISYIPNREMIARESSVKKCFQHRVDKLLSDISMYKSKADTFESECSNIKNRLESEIKKHSSLEEELENEKISTNMAKEELSTTAANYKKQLAAMSDHLTKLNDIISEQKDKINTLEDQVDILSLRGKK